MANKIKICPFYISGTETVTTTETKNGNTVTITKETHINMECREELCGAWDPQNDRCMRFSNYD